MKIQNLEDKKGKVNIDLKIIWNLSEPITFPNGKTVKEVMVADADAVKGDGSPTAKLDLHGDAITKFGHKDKIRIINGYSKKMPNGQFRITSVNKFELIEKGPKPEGENTA